MKTKSLREKHDSKSEGTYDGDKIHECLDK